MKVKIETTIEIDDKHVPILVASSKDSGHGYDGTTNNRELIKRMLIDTIQGRIVRAMDDYRGSTKFGEST